MSSFTDGLGLPFLLYGNAGHFIYNESMLTIDQVIGRGAISTATSYPAGNPAEHDMYIIIGTPPGSTEWANAANNSIAFYYNGSWRFIEPKDGLRVWNRTDNCYWIFSTSGDLNGYWGPMGGGQSCCVLKLKSGSTLTTQSSFEELKTVLTPVANEYEFVLNRPNSFAYSDSSNIQCKTKGIYLAEIWCEVAALGNGSSVVFSWQFNKTAANDPAVSITRAERTLNSQVLNSSGIKSSFYCSHIGSMDAGKYLTPLWMHTSNGGKIENEQCVIKVTKLSP